MPNHSPDSELAMALASARMRAIRMSLLNLHKTLLDAERHRYQRAHGVEIGSPHQVLQLVLRDPWFAWLRPISELIVQADERLSDDHPVQMEDVRAFASQVQQLLQHDLGGPQFRDEYHRSLQDLPDVVMAHAQIVKLLAEQG
jgi:hypothetical protein